MKYNKKNVSEFIQEAKENGWIERTGTHDEQGVLRSAIKKLKKEGKFYVPTAGFYIPIEDAYKFDPEYVELYANQMVRYWLTMYFVTVKYLRKYIKDKKLTALMGTIDDYLKEDKPNE